MQVVDCPDGPDPISAGQTQELVAWLVRVEFGDDSADFELSMVDSCPTELDKHRGSRHLGGQQIDVDFVVVEVDEQTV